MMKRRSFLEGLFAASALRPLAAAPFVPQEPAPAAPDPAVKRVLVMFKCHLDVGFVDTQANVIRKYFDVYYPQAIRTAAALRQAGEDRYVWTTGSWLLYEYLERAAGADRKRMEQAVAAGDIAWHAIPFTWQTELMDRSLISGALGLSHSLDRRFGRVTTGSRMTDVPGHTRALVAPLVEHGVKLLNIGVNSASTPPDVPDIFDWKDPEGHSITVVYHPHDYGGIVRVPGSDLALAMEMRNDNSGPHTVEEIHKIYAGLRRQFPNAKVQASNLSEIANAVEPYRGGFPVVTAEIGDTWIYGVPSDPLKVARYRELARLRTEWIAGRKLAPGDAADLALSAQLSFGSGAHLGHRHQDLAGFRPLHAGRSGIDADGAQVQGGAGKLGGETAGPVRWNRRAARRPCAPRLRSGCAASSRRRPTPGT